MTSNRNSTLQDRLRLLSSQVGGPSAFAVLMGIHRGTAYDFLKGIRQPPQARLEKIAAMFPCDIHWLLTGDGTPPDPSAARILEAKGALKATKALESGQSEPGDIFGLGPRPGFNMPLGMVRRGRQAKLEVARERVLTLLQMNNDEALIVSVLGQSLYDEVKAGRACPSAKLLFALAETLEVKAGWVLGLEE